ncbi:MAG: hypothetical protein HW405_649 [Candidatus Berkelbacteria bacterium]|nr:hypothetical protein [Candidatus Berkelbacteria bacterium]
MLTIFWRTIKDRRNVLIIYVLVSVGVLWMYIGLFPSFKEQATNLEQLIKNYPEGFLKAFNFDIKSFTTIEGFLATEQFSFMWPMLTLFMLIGYAGYALTGEVEKGTIELMLSQPFSRAKLFFAKYLAGLKMFSIYVIFSVLAAVPLCLAYNVSFHSKNFLTMTVLAFIFGLAVYSIAMFFSSIFSDKGKVFFTSGGILVVMYILNILASIKDSLSNLKYASFFYYFNPSKALVYNQIDHWSYLVFLLTALIFTILGVIIFSRRDVTT